MISRSLLLRSLPLNHFPPCIFSWFSLLIHNIMARLLEIHFWNLPCRRSTTQSSRTMLGIWFPFLLVGNLSDADGSIGPRAQRMDRSEDTTLGGSSLLKLLVCVQITLYHHYGALFILQLNSLSYTEYIMCKLFIIHNG
jgi:hypothetical protein